MNKRPALKLRWSGGTNADCRELERPLSARPLCLLRAVSMDRDGAARSLGITLPPPDRLWSSHVDHENAKCGILRADTGSFFEVDIAMTRHPPPANAAGTRSLVTRHEANRRRMAASYLAAAASVSVWLAMTCRRNHTLTSRAGPACCEAVSSIPI